MFTLKTLKLEICYSLTQKGQGTNMNVGSPWPLIKDQTNKPILAIIVLARVNHQSPISLGWNPTKHWLGF
jgi:hypothetical protein